METNYKVVCSLPFHSLVQTFSIEDTDQVYSSWSSTTEEVVVDQNESDPEAA